MVVRAFDGTRREVTGEIEIEMQIGPCTFNIKFQVMDISSSYNCLLGRPWIHIAGAVPSTLHQKIKFVTEGQLVCISAKEDMIDAASSGASYVEADEKAMECSFRSLKFVNAVYVKEGAKIPMPKLSKVTHLGIKQVPGKGARVGKGLGKRLQGILRPIIMIQKKDRFGLGYKPNRQERQRFLEKKRQKRVASFLGKKAESMKMDIPPLSSSFLSAGFINPKMIQDDDEEMMVETFGSLSIDMVEVEDQETKDT